MQRTLLLALATVCSVAPLQSQAAIVGTWKVTYPAGARVENGVQTAIMGTGTLRIEARGDSLVGELISDPVPDLPPPTPVRMSGPVADGPVILTAHRTGRVEINGEAKPIAVTSTWRLEARGDGLLGSLSHQVEGFEGMAQEPGPVSGTRVRN